MIIADQRPIFASLVQPQQPQQSRQLPFYYNQRTGSSTSLSSASSGSSFFTGQGYGYQNGGSHNHCFNSCNNNNNNTLLLSMMDACDWAGCLARIASHPSEVQTLQDEEGRTVLHIACDNDAPAVVVQALLKAWPQSAAVLSSESHMTPLHVLCSSSHASAHVVRVLIELGPATQFQIKDPDGDLALHTAARCGAPLEVLDALVRACPAAASERDLEGLTPLLRLWVRYFVTLGGEEAIQAVRCWDDVTGELRDAWDKTKLLLKSLYTMHTKTQASPASSGDFPHVLHAAAAVDCPRPIVKMAATLYPEQLSVRDDRGLTPLAVAAQAPTFKVRDLTEVGYSLEEMVHDGSGESSDEDDSDETMEAQPSVLEILLNASPSAARVPDAHVGRLPLHWATSTRKRWNQGVDALVETYPEALASPDPCLGLYPFQLAAMKDTAATTPNDKTRLPKADLTTIYELMRVNPSLVTKTPDGLQ